jgi:hypothetical protein
VRNNYYFTQDTAGVLLSIDLHKAIGSVFHEFMREVYKFFGFGEYFLRLSETLGNERCARIIFEFLEIIRRILNWNVADRRGTVRICQQICIFKIELDPAVKLVYLSFIVPRPVEGRVDVEADLATENKTNLVEAKGYTVSPKIRSTKKKVSSFADDLQAAVKAEYESLLTIKNLVLQFGFISGLRTNVEKTTMMRIGNLDTVLDP